MRYVIWHEDNDQYAHMGGKGKSLAELQRAELPVPMWCVISPDAFYDSLTEPQLRLIESSTDIAKIQKTVAEVVPSADVTHEIDAALNKLNANAKTIAVRSSAVDEDGIQNSFAGQLESFLFVDSSNAAEKVAQVWRSGFSDRIFSYRRENGLSALPQAPAVILQRMIDADCAGVAFSADPVSGRRGVAIVSAVKGIADDLVSGKSNADTYTVDRSGTVVERNIIDSPILTDTQAVEIADLARRAQMHFGRPQDIEWAIKDGIVYIVQSRPITSISSLPDPDGDFNLWDNSNIAESYNGVTTPLTFSFARSAYESVYRQFCRMMGVSESKIDANDATFRRMIGLIRGRIYYNLLSWYRILAILPGFAINRRFMEQMMGVKEELPQGVLRQIGQTTARDKVIDSLSLLKTCAKMVVNYVDLPRSIRRFYKRLDVALAQPPIALDQMNANELAQHYLDLEQKLLMRWDAPLVNDFFAMIFYGLLRVCAQKWCRDTDGTMQNDLLCGQGDIISAQPARRIRQMADIVDPEFIETLCDGQVEVILQKMRNYPEFSRLYTEYIDLFGDRCLEELKLESITLHENPLLLLRSIGKLAQSPRRPDDDTIETDLRRSAEDRSSKAIGRNPVRRILFSWILKNARNRVRDRENLRFERTRAFGRVRRIFLEIGKRFASDGLLDEPRDIFYLETSQIFGIIDGTAASVDLAPTVSVRKAEFARYKEMSPPDDRFETHGVVHQGNDFCAHKSSHIEEDDNCRKGIGCCPGIIQGRVRIILDPQDARMEPGEILVAERTDPGWIMFFASAAGVLVERGSLLSHSAIVAREMCVPTVVAVAGITKWLNDGDIVEFNGSTGIVKRIAENMEATDEH